MGKKTNNKEEKQQPWLLFARHTELPLHRTEACHVECVTFFIFTVQKEAASEQLSLGCEPDCGPSAATPLPEVKDFKQAGLTSTRGGIFSSESSLPATRTAGFSSSSFFKNPIDETMVSEQPCDTSYVYMDTNN